jgi:molybdopterin molybdotransferase
MLLALLAKPNVLVSDGGCFPDDPFALAGALKRASRTADLVLMSGGTADGDEDHSIRAILLAGGKARHLHVALKPGKPSIIGRLGDTVVIGLPGNPIAALVNCLLLGQSAIEALFGRNSERPKGLPAVSIKPYRHARGRTEFSPARIVNRSSERVEIEILGRGGSARFAPLLSAEGLAEIASSTGELAAGGAVRFHSFPAFTCV